MPVPVTQHRQGEQGTIFIVVVAVVMLMSSIMLLGTGAFHIADNSDRVRETQKRQDFLVHELAAYAQRVNALPCPADPGIDPMGHEFGYARKSCGIETSTGLIPFRTLNLSEHDARDGWGRFMTYKISPVMANLDKGTKIFMRCRRFPWFDGSDSEHPANLFPAKARFCCPPDDGMFPPASDLQIFASADGIAGGTVLEKIGRKDDQSTYDDIDKPVNIGAQGALAPIPTEVGNEELFAVAIISHGKNGIGAWLGNGTPLQLTGTAGRDEEVNLGNNGHAIAHAMNPAPGPDYFDDIAVWRTQITLMGELNSATCYAPWR
jgi:hypothetical protein